jgi:cyclophilin family peptidyl-prolyl cis-trans isomerase
MKIKKKTFYYTITAIITLIAILIFVNYGGKMNRVATFETNQGTFKIELFENGAPITAGNFIKLAQQGYYDGTRFHRIIANFMIQGGDPLSKNTSMKNRWGTGGPGYSIKDEFGAGLKNNKGTISMANSGPNTGGSQFFINVANNNFLDGKHAVFGKVVEGYELVEKMSKVKTDSNDGPVNEIVINKITIE